MYALAKLKKDKRVSVDRHYENTNEIGVDRVFIAVKEQRAWGAQSVYLVADGYGSKQDYNNGSIYTSIKNVVFITPMCLKESKLLDGYRHML